jgi:plastocyanin
MNKSIIIGIIAVLVLGVGGYLVFHKSAPTQPTNSNASNSSNSTDTSSQAQDESSSTAPAGTVAATITYGKDGFSPATTTVKSGDTVMIKNESSESVQFDSDPHPDHTDDVELNVGVIAPGESATFKVTKTGSHGYHNHLNSTRRGTLVVQ